MRLVVTGKRPCELEPGQIRRVPQNLARGMVGYHVCCPRCGFVTVAVNGNKGMVITESTDRTKVSLSMPLRCTYCSVLIHLDDGIATLEEDENVRPVRYR